MATDNTSDTKQAIAHCIQGLPPPWYQADPYDIECISLNLGNSNRLFKCTLRDKQVMVRMYGSELTGKGNKFKSISEACEAVVVHKLGELRLGPALLSLFDGGRIEKFLPSRQFTVKEFCSPLMAPVIARKLARIHQLQMPLPQPAEDFMYRQMQALNKAVQANHELQQIPAEVFERYRTKIEKLRSFDFGSLIERLRRYQSTFKSRLVFTHNDLNRTNILMLDHPLNGKSDETPDPDSVAERVLIIDFEYCSYGFRWADISTYFQEIAFERWELQPINDPFSSYPEKTIRRDFFDHYLDEWSRTKVLESIDTPYQLELECKFGALCVNLIRVLWAMAHPKINDEKHAFWKITYKRLEMLRDQLNEFGDLFD